MWMLSIATRKVPSQYAPLSLSTRKFFPLIRRGISQAVRNLKVEIQKKRKREKIATLSHNQSAVTTAEASASIDNAVEAEVGVPIVNVMTIENEGGKRALQRESTTKGMIVAATETAERRRKTARKITNATKTVDMTGMDVTEKESVIGNETVRGIEEAAGPRTRTMMTTRGANHTTIVIERVEARDIGECVCHE